MRDPIDDYILANRDLHKEADLTNQLVAAGHDPTDIQAAWDRLEEWHSSEPQEVMKSMMVREYKSIGALEKDANKLAKKGWELVSTTDVQAKSGIARKVTTVALPVALFFPHPSHIVATFRKVLPDSK